MSSFELISHTLCPYVQRVAITLAEKQMPFARTYIALNDKPDWFRAVSPLGKVPVLQTEQGALFESAPILEYLEDIQLSRLHPQDPFLRARHRAWIEFGSGILNDIALFYSAPHQASFDERRLALRRKFEQIEAELAQGPYFSGPAFCLVDAVYGPIFRYWEAFDEIGDFGIFSGLQKVAAWRIALAERPSVKTAVTPDYRALLHAFLRVRQSHLASLITKTAGAV